MSDRQPPSPLLSAPKGRVESVVGATGSERRRLVTNGMWTSGVFLANAVVMFLLSPFVLAQLGRAGYGIWEQVMTLTGYFGFVDLGIKPAAVYFIARHDARGERDDVNRYVNSAAVVFAIGGALVLLGAFVVRPYFPGWFGVPVERADEARSALLIVAASIALTLPLHAFSAVVVGKQRFALTSGVDLVVLLAKTAAIVLALRAGYGIVALAWISFGADALEMGTKAVLGFRLEPTLRLAPRLADIGRAKGLLFFGLGAILVNFAQLVIWRTDSLVIGATLGVEMVAVFAIASKVPFQIRSLTSAASRALAPAATRLDAVGDSRKIFAMASNASRVMLLVAGPMIAFLCVVSGPFLERWQGAGMRTAAAVSTSIVLALGALGPVASQPFEHVLYGARRLVPLGVLSLVEAAANLLTSIVLVRSMGIVGVAIGTTVPALVVRLVALPAYAARAFGGSLVEALRALVLPLVATAVTTGALLLVVPLDASLSWPALVALAVGTAATYAVIAKGLGALVPGKAMEAAA